MTLLSTTVRATHLLTNAAWFGGSLMGATGLSAAAAVGDDAQERSEISSDGWSTWGPIQGGAIALHLVSGLAIVADNRRRTLLHPPATMAVGLKTALTAAAVAASVAAYRNGHALGEAAKRQDHDPEAAAEASELRDRMRWLRWATPATTGGLLVLDAYLGEQQRGVVGLLDRPLASLRGRR